MAASRPRIGPSQVLGFEEGLLTKPRAKEVAMHRNRRLTSPPSRGECQVILITVHYWFVSAGEGPEE